MKSSSMSRHRNTHMLQESGMSRHESPFVDAEVMGMSRHASPMSRHRSVGF